VHDLNRGAVLSFIAVLVASACSSTPPPSPALLSLAHAGRAEVDPGAVAEVEAGVVDEPTAEPVMTQESPAPARVSLAAVEVYGRCFLKTQGVSGTCVDTTACTSAGGHLATPGLCGGPPNVSCCTEEPRAETHPPAGWNSIPQTRVTRDMYLWARSIVESPTEHPMGSKTTQFFGSHEVMARVEWHTPNQGHVVMHRGVTLYEPL
jgi:hypothetical protein